MQRTRSVLVAHSLDYSPFINNISREVQSSSLHARSLHRPRTSHTPSRLPSCGSVGHRKCGQQGRRMWAFHESGLVECWFGYSRATYARSLLQNKDRIAFQSACRSTPCQSRLGPESMGDTWGCTELGCRASSSCLYAAHAIDRYLDNSSIKCPLLLLHWTCHP